ncbi:hypothetical protein BC833DRAFT_609721 [Globomyces pollinis-pini]|nr:hypothetical protein BC833DRAFT_609721 [Globomyces pollinis-pini]
MYTSPLQTVYNREKPIVQDRTTIDLPLTYPNRLIVYYFGRPIDLTNFEHPGGNFLHQFNGKDITNWVLNAHHSDRSGKVAKLIKLRTCYDLPNKPMTVDSYTLSQKIDEYAKISLSMVNSYVINRIIEYLLLFSACFYFSESARIVQVILCVIVFRSVFTIHDFGHWSVLQNAKWDTVVCRILSILFLGFDAFPTSRQHFIHHAFPNVLNNDTALETGVFVWHENYLIKDSYLARAFVDVQWFFWYTLIPILGTLSQLLHGKIDVSTKDWLDYLPFLFLGFIRWFSLAFFFDFHPLHILNYVLIPTFLGFGFPCFVAQLNHFHMEIHDEDKFKYTGFIETMISSTQDSFVDIPFLEQYLSIEILSWFFGGLNSHAAHHLFSMVHSDSLSIINAKVNTWIGKPFHNDCLTKVLYKSFEKIRNPLEHPKHAKKISKLGKRKDSAIIL